MNIIFKTILKQTFWQLLGKVTTSLSTFIILGLVARSYGKEGTGTFTLALTYLAIFYLISDFGFNAHVLSSAHGIEHRVQKEWNKLLGTRIIWSGILVILAVGLLPFWPFSTPQFTQAVSFGSFAIIAFAIFTTCNLIFQNKLRYDLSVLASISGTLFSLVIFIVLIFNKFSIPFLLIVHLAGWIVISLSALLIMRKFLHHLTPIFNFKYALLLFKKSWPIGATLTLNVLYFRADSFMIAYFKSVADVGIYNIAYSIFQTALVLPTFIMNSYYPIMLKSLGGAKLVALSFLGFSLAGTILTIVLSPFVIWVLTGGGFSESIKSLQILSFGFPAYFLSSLCMWILIAKGNYKKMFFICTSGLILNLILNFIYIPQYSYIASSWITVISEYAILAMQIMVLFFKLK
ncbi:MAG: flippase [Candidatus Daviesbacteria bacterium]|nr:flippase [Candidatus Daviesbacteria bacterium]